MTEFEQRRRAIEYWFRRRGLPAVVRGWPQDLLVRIVPAIVWLALSELLYWLLIDIDGDAEFGTRLNSDAFIAAYTTALAGLAVVPTASAWFAARWTRHCALRGNGPTSALLITAAYVLAWPLLGHAFGVTDAVLFTVVINAGTVGVLLALTVLGAGSIFCWALRAALRQLRGIGTMTSRALPLLLLVTTFGFFTAEIWQIAGTVPRARMWSIIGFFAALGALFLFSVLSSELSTLITRSESSRLAADLPEHPFGPVKPRTEDGEPVPPLTRLERANMVFVLLLTQVLQVLVFGILVFVLFVVLGRLAVTPGAIKAWVTHDPTPGTLFGIQIPVANEVVQVSMFIAAFSALYFTATIVTDAAHRKAFFDPVLGHLKISLAGRAAYLARLSSRPREAKQEQPEDGRRPA